MNEYNFTKQELEAVILVQRRIIEALEAQLEELQPCKSVYDNPQGELPETD
jgi:hypothetical protein